jgi:hypothetical protein
MIGNFPPPSIPMASPSGNLGIDEGPEPPARDEPLQQRSQLTRLES